MAISSGEDYTSLEGILCKQLFNWVRSDGDEDNSLLLAASNMYEQFPAQLNTTNSLPTTASVPLTSSWFLSTLPRTSSSLLSTTASIMNNINHENCVIHW